MATNYQVNIVIQAGVDFVQEFYLTNPDRSPKNITGFKFASNMSKHTGSIDATRTTSSKKVHRIVPFRTRVVNGKKGIFSISLPSSDTKRLKEGKYVYSAVMRDKEGTTSEAVSGLCFVEIAHGVINENSNDEVVFDGGGAMDYDDPVIYDGGSSTTY